MRWIKDYGFAALVVVGAATAGCLAATVAVPDPVPYFALNAREVYRLEVGMVFFVAFYLSAMAIALALDGRGFAELGTKGLKAGKIVDQAASRHQQGLRYQRTLDRRTKERLREHDVRLEKLEEKSLG